MGIQKIVERARSSEEVSALQAGNRGYMAVLGGQELGLARKQLTHAARSDLLQCHLIGVFWPTPVLLLTTPALLPCFLHSGFNIVALTHSFTTGCDILIT